MLENTILIIIVAVATLFCFKRIFTAGGSCGDCAKCSSKGHCSAQNISDECPLNKKEEQ